MSCGPKKRRNTIVEMLRQLIVGIAIAYTVTMLTSCNLVVGAEDQLETMGGKKKYKKFICNTRYAERIKFLSIGTVT